MLQQWVGKLEEKLTEKCGEEVDILKFYNCTTFDVMGDLTFGEGERPSQRSNTLVLRGAKSSATRLTNAGEWGI